MGDLLIMSRKERQRKAILEGVVRGSFTLVEASNRMGVGYRQGKRIWKVFRQHGDAGLTHGGRGKSSNRRYSDEFQHKVITLYREKYLDFGPTFAAEKLEEEEGIKIHSETLRLWLKKEGLWSPHRRRKSYRRQRQRRSAFGEMLQIDGSDHLWFEGNADRACLLDMVDDATGITMARLATGETTEVLLTCLLQWVKRYGIPKSVYVDLKNVYVSAKKLVDEDEWTEDCDQARTAFEKVCEKLGIEIIKAYSPQAKGRVERKHAVFQDRFVKELKLKKIKNIEDANKFLDEVFLDKINQKFAKKPSSDRDVHLDVKSVGDLNEIFCWEFSRQVNNDWTIRFQNQRYQLGQGKCIEAKPKKVVVRKHLDGSVSIWAGLHRVHYHLVDGKEMAEEIKEEKERSSTIQAEYARQNKTSPWRQFNSGWLGKQKTKPSSISLKPAESP